MTTPATLVKDAAVISIEQDLNGAFTPRKRLQQNTAWNNAPHSRDLKTPPKHEAKMGHQASSSTTSAPAVSAHSKSKTPRKAPRERKNSGQLRRVKNSTEVLRQRSLKSKGTGTTTAFYPDLGSLGREGRQFTVGNVGNNGLIYLRPMVNPGLKRNQPHPFNFTPPTPPKTISRTRAGTESNVRHSIWSTSQASELPELVVRKGVKRSESNSEQPLTGGLRPNNHQRAYSCSTIDTQHIPARDNRGTFKIVIDRRDSGRPRSAEEAKPSDNPHPVLEVPIPHWRLGSPRFTDQGTPILRSSVYTMTRASSSQYPRSSQFLHGELDRLFPIPPPGMCRLQSSAADSCIFPQSMVLPTRHHSGLSGTSGVTGSSAALPASTFFEIAEPVEPEIFDVLAVNMDDPSVVRYAQHSKEIVAATPARIVAQISSENFMDYELVSDFFLTFRSYLSGMSLLSLLLARLHWAINRLQDDGRIIRIRTFAALRHWILNYFVDDFVSDAEIRIQFCEKINAMYKEVKARTGGGVSDLKILLDLKKCWNGRCAMFWDSPEFIMDGKSDDEIMPGGIIKEKNQDQDQDQDQDQMIIADERRVSEPSPINNIIIQPETKTALKSWFGEPPGVQPQGHNREVSGSTVNSIPMSPSSELSIQPFSCSLPTMRKSSSPRRTKQSHPVPVTPTNQTISSSAPPPSIVWRRPAHAHKRSGSFSDSVRDGRTPLPFVKVDNQDEDFLVISPQSGSLIRGHLYQPSHPYVEMVGPPSPSHELEQLSHLGRQSDTYFETTLKPSVNNSPGVKTIIGSIRRALSSRQSPNPRPFGHTKSKNPMIPLGVGGHNDQQKKPIGYKGRVRIDLLCAQVSQSYEAALKKGAVAHQQTGIGMAFSGDGEAIDHSCFESPSQQDTRPAFRRIESNMTMGSKSIVIVDDTRPDMPAMSGALTTPRTTVNFSERAESPILGDSEKASNRPRFSRLDSDRSRRSRVSDIRSSWRSSSVDRGRTSRLNPPEHMGRSASSHLSGTLERTFERTTGSMSTMLRKYASYQSTIAKHARPLSTDEGLTPSSPVLGDGGFEPPKSRMLRRRPGGDLRNVTNVQDLEFEVKHDSAGSFTTVTDSVVGSALFMSRNRTVGAPLSPGTQTSGSIAAEPQQELPKKVSMINTHSARPLRPSFEAAVAAFSRIPDDEDGGRDSTLLKLEGKYIKPPSLIRKTTNSQEKLGLDSSCSDLTVQVNEKGEKVRRSHEPSTYTETTVGPSQISSMQTDPERLRVTVRSIAESDLSYCSIPLLERGLADETPTNANSAAGHSDATLPRPLFSRDGPGLQPESSHPSIEVVEETESLRRLGQQSRSATDREASFFLDDDAASDLSSELSVDVIDPDEATEREYPSPLTAAPGTAVSGIAIPSHPLAHPPSPPITLPNTVTNTPHTQVNPMTFQDKPLTPEPSPTHMKVKLMAPQPQPAQTRSNGNSGHIAFILACDSEVLAQQFTLIEKAALAEVDWKDLVDMKWKSQTPVALNWVDFLQIPKLKGLDMAIARFNLMVKWALSEIVMTQDIFERARTIMKYIHVAVHCRKIRNYATMLQIVIALSSGDCAALTKTWDIVSAAEKKMLKDMEALIQPIRNFHDLRVEMETTDLQAGCIPFVGLYVHDLTYNAQKPAQIPSSNGGEPLINFERYRTAATIVKSLLRLIDASSKYTFEPVPMVIERCLWMATLPDEKITALSKMLE